MKKIFIILTILTVFACSKKEDDPQPNFRTTTVAPEDDTTLIKITMYSNRVPFIYHRQVNRKWVDDTIKTNAAVRYEAYDILNKGIGYWATMNLQGKNTDSLYIQMDYRGKTTHMSSLKGQSAAYVLIDNVKP